MITEINIPHPDPHIHLDLTAGTLQTPVDDRLLERPENT